MPLFLPAMDDILAYASLFGVAFAAATVLPAQSEPVLVALQVAGYDPVLLVVVASIGNTLGAIVNWVLGRAVERYKDRKWFPVSQKTLARASGWYAKWGRWSLLLSWSPIGDALTVAAGVMREPLWSFVAIVAFAKTARYVVLALATAGFIG